MDLLTKFLILSQIAMLCFMTFSFASYKSIITNRLKYSMIAVFIFNIIMTVYNIMKL